MARAEQVTKLPLDRWAKLLGLNPLHFNGIYDPGHPMDSCEQPWMQWEWQDSDRVSREEVARAIHEAEEDIEKALGYRLLPTWETDEWQATIRPFRADLFNLNISDVRGMAQVIESDWGYIVSGGIRAKTLIDDAVAIVYSDTDGDGYTETATIIVAVTAGTSPSELHVYLPGFSGNDEYEVRPLTSVSVVGAVATIVFRREQVVRPELYDDLMPPSTDSHQRGVDGLVDANFETTVDVYRVYNDPQTQVSFLWEPFNSNCDCGSSGCVHCAYSTQTGCLIVRGNPRQGLLGYFPGSWNATTQVFDAETWAVSRQPDIVRLYYYAGWRDKNLSYPTIQMDRHWERVVAYYAASKLERGVCECSNVHEFVSRWQRDLAIAGKEESLRVPDSMLDNPFGTARGAVYAWRRVVDNAIGKVVMQ